MTSKSVFASIENEEMEYQAFIAHVNHGTVTAGFMDSVTEKISKIKEFASLIGSNYQSILSYFKDREIFSFFNKFNWDIKAIIESIKAASIFMDKLLSEIAKKLHSNGKVKRISEISDSLLHEIDTMLKKHPMLKHMGGILIAGILLYNSMNGAYLGSVADFDMSDVLLALSGKLTFFDVFQGEQGIKILVSLALGLTPITLSYGLWSNIPKASVTLFNLIKKWK